MSDGRQPARCGTTSGYRRHRLDDTATCNACARAQAEYDARRRSADKTQQGDRLRSRAQTRALLVLSREHPEEYRELYLAEVARLRAEARE